MIRPETDAELPAFAVALGLPGLFDTHVHFLPESVMRKVRAVFDGLTQPPWPLAYRPDEAAARARLAAMGVRRYTTLAYAHRPGMAAWLNRYTLALAASDPAAIASFTFYPEPEAETYVAAALAAGGRCAKLHLQVGAFDANDPLLDAVWAQLQRQRIPVVVHAGAVYGGGGVPSFCGPPPMRHLNERFPSLPLIVAHMGAPDYAAFLALAEAAPSVHLDTTMAFASEMLGHFPRQLVERLRPLGEAGKVLFGSDFPSLPHRYAQEVAALVDLDLGEDWLRRVFWHNAHELFGPAPSD